MQNKTRPTIKLDDYFAVFDTGSSMLILDLPDSIIRNKFGGILLSSKTSIINGIGQQSNAKYYRLSHFSFGKITFKNIIAVQAPILDKSTDILIGACLYGGGTIYEINSGNNTIHFKYPKHIFYSNALWTKDSSGIWRKIDLINGKLQYL